jgi:outer membrane protein TolC
MKSLITLILTLLTFIVTAQNIDYNRIILPDNTGDIEFSEKLIQLAWQNHPDNQNVKDQKKIAELNYKLSKREWLGNFRLSGNLNEFNIDPTRDLNNRSQFFPRYNLSLGFPLGDLFMNPLQNKQRNIEVDQSQNDINATKLLVRRDVLQAYNNYLLQEEIYKIQRLAMDNAETNHAIVEKGFEQGEVTYENYNNSFTNLNQRKITILRAENDYQNSKLVLEEMIGIPLENVN